MSDLDRELLVVEVEGRRCALRASDVLEVLPMVFVDPLPGAPAVVEGMIDLRGRIVPVVSMRHRLGLPDRPADPRDRLVVVELPDRVVAVHVDAAVDLRTVDPDAIENAPAIAGTDGAVGIARLDDGLVVIRSLATFLASDEAVQLDDALERAR